MDTNGDLRVLIVDDEPETAKLLGMLLRHKVSAKSDTALDCETARKKLSESSFDLITLDFQLPDCDGLSFLREILKMKECPPVVMVTGHGDERTAVEAFKQGASGYVVKDARLNVMLVEEVKSALIKRELRKAELELINKDKMLMHLYESAAEGIIVGGSDGKFEYVNPASAEIFGFDSPEEMIGTPIADRYAKPEERDELLAILMENGTVSDYGLNFKRKDGSVFFSEMNAALFKDEDGNILRTTAYTSYRTQQREAAKAMRQSEEKYRQMFENIKSGVAIYEAVGDGEDFVVVDCNKAADRVISKKDSMGKTLRELIPDVEETALYKTLRKVWSTGELVQFQPFMKSSDSIERWIEGYAYKLPTGEIVAFFNDVTAQKEAEAALVESEARLKDIYNSSVEGIGVVNAEGLIEYSNPRIVEMFGFDSSKEMLGTSVADRYANPEDRQKLLEILKEEGSVRAYELEIKKKDGTKIWVLGNMSLSFDENGVPSRSIAFFTDITEKKKAEEELEENKRKLRSIYESSIEGIAIMNKERVFEFANSKAAQIFGFEKAEDMIGVSGSDLYRYPEDRDKILGILQSEGSINDYDVECKRKDGTFFWARINGALEIDVAGNPKSMTGFFVDITDEKRAAQDLKKSEDSLREFYESAIEGVAIANPEGIFTFVNPRFAEMFGYGSAEEVIGIPTISVYADSRRRDELIEALNEKGFVRGFEAELLRKDGSRFWGMLNIVMHRDDKGDYIESAGFMVDITEQKKAEEELRSVNRELEAFAHTVSHNLKGPLSSVGMAAELLRSELGDGASEEALELLENIDSNTSKGHDRIKDLLWLAESGQRPVEVRNIQLRGLIDEIIEEVNTKDVKLSIDDDFGELVADERQIHQIFSNILLNAVQHNTSKRPEIFISYGGTSDEGVHRYLIRDNGPGIEDGKLEEIFTPFYKGSTTGGTGLGLSIARQIAAVYGGNIHPHNDNGAVFEVTLKDYNPG